ncbi:hypothetical protein BG000_001460, partial [Podila horticola]
MTHTGSVRLSYHEGQRIALKTTPSSSSSSSSPYDDLTTANQDQPLSTPTPPLFTPIWDYEKFPVGPCVRERDRVSQEVQQALLSNTTSGTKYKGGEDLARGSSLPGISSSSTLHRRYGSRSGSSGNYGGGVGRVSRHGSRHGSCTVSSQSIPSSPIQEGFGPLGAPESTTTSATAQPTSPTSPASGSVNFVPTSPSKFDQIKAQMERVRSIRVSTTHSSASSSSSSGGRVDPSSKISLMHSATSSSSSSSSTSSISVDTKDAKNSNKKKGILHRLFHPSISSKRTKKISKSEEATQPTRDQSQPLASPQPQPQPEMQEQQPRPLRPKLHQLDHPSPSPSRHHQHHHHTIGSSSSCSSSRSSLLNEKDALSRTSSASHPPRISTGPLADLEKASSSNNNASLHDPPPSSLSRPPSPTFSSSDNDRSPVERAQDRWREEWLGPSGAILTLFRDQPAKFDCPHCGAIKVVSDVQYVPGVMSYLVAFGLLFLTLGALSYLPFRKQHEGTKDCVHWCPQCGKPVARFMRATGT